MAATVRRGIRPWVTRFAPSPTGALHLGHGFSAVLGHDLAQQSGGRFQLRIEDIDVGRSRMEYVDGIVQDLTWLGLSWDGPALMQTRRFMAHRDALLRLERRGLLYACICTRADIETAAGAPHSGETIAYPGTCRGRERPGEDTPFAWRLDLAATGLPLEQPWRDLLVGPRRGRADAGGDPVLMRKDMAPAYHLACVLDDAFQGVNLVVRGRDLEAATPLQRLLQRLLGLPEPTYLHHRLLLAADGRRLAKRDRAETLAAMQANSIDGQALAAQLRMISADGHDAHLPVSLR